MAAAKHKEEHKGWGEEEPAVPLKEVKETDTKESGATPQAADAPVQQVAATSVKGYFTIDRFFQFGGMSSKKSKRLVITIAPPIGGTVTVGGNTNKFLASDVGFQVIESCSNLVVLTTNNNQITKVVPATPSPDGTFVGLADITATATGAIADLTLTQASNEIAQIALDGY